MRLVTVGAALLVLTGWLSAQQVVPGGVTPPVSIVPSLAIGLVGTGGAQATVGGTLFTSTTAASTTGLTEETLASYTLPANTLAVNGRGVRITVAVNYAANANAKTAQVYFGVTVVGTSGGAAASPNGGWGIFSIDVIRTSPTAQFSFYALNQLGIGASSAVGATETLSGAVIIKVTGTTPTTIGDVTFRGIVIEAI